MIRGGTVTGLAADVDLRPGGLKTSRNGIIILFEICRVAEGALEIPILVDPGPVHRIAGRQSAVGVEMKPALTALVFCAGVPRDSECLQPAVVQFDEILLKRPKSKRVADLKIRQVAVRAVCPNPELVVLLEESREHSVVVEGRVVEPSKDSFVGRLLHGGGMLRALPLSKFELMALGATC